MSDCCKSSKQKKNYIPLGFFMFEADFMEI